MDNRLKQKVSKMFQSCRPKDTVNDVSDHPFFFPENPHHPDHRQLIDLFSPKPSIKTTSFPPKNPECRKPEKPTKKKPHHHRKPKKTEDFSSFTDNYYHGWRSSDEDDESDDGATLFSSRSLSSESSGNFRKNRAHRKSRKKPIKTSGCGCKNVGTDDVTRLEDGGKVVKDSFAVVKKSNNPHEDFRVSMVEMIVEKQIFGEEELEDLLQCFISLNSEEHHRVIFEVFSEIWETLFTDLV